MPEGKNRWQIINLLDPEKFKTESGVAVPGW